MNLYKILGLSKDATIEEIKRAYKSLVQKHHPDKEGGNNDIFVELQNAYETLIDPVRRKHYDATGEALGNEPSDLEKQTMRINMFLAGLLEQIVNNDDYNENTTDILVLVRKNVTSNKDANQAAVNRAEVLSAKRGRVVTRLTKKNSEENDLCGMLLTANANQRNQIDRLRDAIVDFDKMLSILDDYNYDVDVEATPAPSPNRLFINGSPVQFYSTTGA
jgi:molecular chaperone DnaJ